MDSDTCLYYLRLINSKKIPIISKLLREFGSAKSTRELPRSRFQDLGFDTIQIDLLCGVSSKKDSQRSAQLA